MCYFCEPLTEEMEAIRSRKELAKRISELRGKRSTVGLVPTMGALHLGHLSLVRRCLFENRVTVVSIFVNPTQFNDPSDLDAYPKPLEEDMAKLRRLSPSILVFAPDSEELYPEGVQSQSYSFDGLEKSMEGVHRPGHFEGVATVVEKLFRAVRPDKAYFGEKDFQQLQIIRKLVKQKRMDIEILGCPIERESNGLARSSRNERLSELARDTAGRIYELLKGAKLKFGNREPSAIRDWVLDEIQKEPGMELEYFEIADTETLTPAIKKQKMLKYRAFIAVTLEGVRLIDNIALN